jgi:hypothetical protein
MARLDRAINRRQFVDADGPVDPPIKSGRAMTLKYVDLFADWYDMSYIYALWS